MDLPLAADSLACLPHEFVSKDGAAVTLRILAGDAQPLLAMYLAFQPRNCFQGLPPIKDEVCVKWVREMMQTGIHVVAAARDGRLIGHTALFPINPRKCEMLVVVCPGFQDVGIGTELVRICIDLADELRFERIWLPVDATNGRARHVYKKCGFEYVSSKLGHELDMACEVRLHRRARIAVDPGAPHVPAPCFPLHVVAVPTEAG